MNNIQKIITERRTVRHYLPDVTIERAMIKNLLSAATYAPSGGNLQSWRFLVFDEAKQKEKLRAVAFNQPQITDCSAVIVLLGDLKGYRKAADIYYQAVSENTLPSELAESYLQKYTELYKTMDDRSLLQAVTIDASLAAMQFMLLAKAAGWDTNPMKGFDTRKLMETFNIPDRYTPVLIITVGKQKKPAGKTSRLPIERVLYFNHIEDD